MTTKDKLIHALTAYDQKQSTKRGYNPYALGQYFQRIDEIIADIDAGADPRQAITAGFSGRLADAALRAIGLTATTDQENKGGYTYTPVKAGGTQ